MTMTNPNGFINVRGTETVMHEDKIYVNVEVENCKFEFNKKENISIY